MAQDQLLYIGQKALIEKDGKLLIMIDPDTGADLPGGKIQVGETDVTAALLREVKEETNLDVVETNIIGNYIFERKNEVMLCYHAVVTGEIKLSPELAEYKRYQPHELRPWPRATGFAVADWMRSRGLEVKFIDRPPINIQPKT